LLEGRVINQETTEIKISAAIVTKQNKKRLSFDFLFDTDVIEEPCPNPILNKHWPRADIQMLLLNNFVISNVKKKLISDKAYLVLIREKQTARNNAPLKIPIKTWSKMIEKKN
jgi:hypothetical protein